MDWYFYKITENGNPSKISLFAHGCVFCKGSRMEALT